MAKDRDILRKLFETGLGVAFWTEENIREFLSDIKLPGDAKKFIVDQAKRRKSELTDILSAEIKNFLNKINVHEELQKALAGLIIDVNATLRVDHKGKAVQVTKSRTKRRKGS